MRFFISPVDHIDIGIDITVVIGIVTNIITASIGVVIVFVVRPGVFLQVVFATETFVAQVACVRPLTGVYPSVPGELFVSGEGLLAERLLTLEGPLTCVYPDVSPELAGVRQSYPTVGAFVLLGAGPLARVVVGGADIGAGGIGSGSSDGVCICRREGCWRSTCRHDDSCRCGHCREIATCGRFWLRVLDVDLGVDRRLWLLLALVGEAHDCIDGEIGPLDGMHFSWLCGLISLLYLCPVKLVALKCSPRCSTGLLCCCCE